MNNFNNFKNDELTIFFYQNLLNINLNAKKNDEEEIKTLDQWISKVESKVISLKERSKKFIESSWFDEKEDLSNMDDEDFVYDYIKGEWVCFDNYNRDLFENNKFFLLLTQYTFRWYEKSTDYDEVTRYPQTIDQDIED
jgi:hypothetical protein